tara:strand:- start:85 stop:807 length:723 start_codon:yes stop_codon:yes gene_type:complete
MAFVSSMDSRVAVGLLNATGYARGFSITSTMEALDVTTLADRAKAFIVGLNTSTATLDMLLDTTGTTNAQYQAFNAMKATGPYPITLGVEGFTTGDPVILINGHLTELGQSSTNADVVTATANHQGTGGTDLGVAVEDFTAIVATGNGTARDLTASSARGGVAHLHVTGFATLTSDTITIEHSVDGSTSWATLVTFTAVTALTSQRVEVADGTTVRRYLRVVDTFSGSGSCTRAVFFARR